MESRIQYYSQRITTLEQEVDQLKSNNKRLSLLRLLSALAALGFFYLIFPYSILMASVSAVILSSALGYFIRKYNRNEKNIKRVNRLIQINQNELECLKTRHSNLFYKGKEYLQADHAYAADLDIFGEHSIYQLINRCISRSGQDRLAEYLAAPADNKSITERQEAVRELASMVEWRQNIMQYGLQKQLKNDDPDFVSQWGKKPSPFHEKKALRYSIQVLTAFTIIASVYAIVGNYIPLLILFFVNISLQYFNRKDAGMVYHSTTKRADMLKIYARIIEEFESQEWQSEKLKEIKQKLVSNDIPSFKKIRRLSKLIELLDQRYNLVIQMFVNTLYFYELHLLFRIDKWKSMYGNEIENWFRSIGEIEALSSLANLSFNHPEWTFPEISDQHFQLELQEAGHPMIDENKRVCNDYELKGPGMIHIVTGSNMAGKSTFLRSIGVNIVLALSGAPVCAKIMKTSNVEVNTSMRIKDSIEENESSFYAELKRIQQVLEKVNRKENTLLLLDEILRGTNSKDKHSGSAALIRQLVKYNAVGLVATHDLELSVLEQDLAGHVENRFFDIKIDGEQLYFDYKVQNGVCKTFNAPILMQKMGIEMELINNE